MSNSDLFKKQGYCVLENVFSNETLEDLQLLSNLYIKRTLKRHNNSGNVIYNLFKTGNIASDFVCTDILNNEKIKSLLDDIFKSSYCLREISFFFSLPNNDLQELHSDEICYFSETDVVLPTTSLAIQIPLGDFNYSNGGTRILANTHLNKNNPLTIEEEDLDRIELYTPSLKAGDCMVRDIRTWHGAGVNKSNNVRAMFIVVYNKSWLNNAVRVSEDVYYSIKRENRNSLKRD